MILLTLFLTPQAIALVACFVAICACVGYYVKVTEFKVLVQCMERREPFPVDTFQHVWAAHRELLLEEILKFAQHRFQKSFEDSMDTETAKKEAEEDWEYIHKSILRLKAKESESSIWSDEGEALTAYLSYASFKDLITIISQEMSGEGNLDLESFQEICVQTFGFPSMKVEMKEYHKMISTEAEVIYMDMTNATLTGFENECESALVMLDDYATDDVGIEIIPTGPSHVTSSERSLDSSEVASALNRVLAALIEKVTDDHVLQTTRVKYFEVLRLCVQVPFHQLSLALRDMVAAIKQDVGGIRVNNIPKKDMQQPLLIETQSYMPHLHRLVSVDTNDINERDAADGVSWYDQCLVPPPPTSLGNQSLEVDSLPLFKKHLDELVFPELLRAYSMVVLEEFKALMMSVAARAGLGESAVSVAGVKGVARMRVKRGQYEDNTELDKYPPSAYVTDSLRCSLICPLKSPSMFDVWSVLSKDPQLEVLCLKNKAADGQNPYNLHVNALFQPQCCPSKIVVEIQIQNEHIYGLKEVNHRMYELVRAPNAEKV